MKKSIFLAALALFTLSSCEDFLDSENYTKKNSENFPVDETDANQLLTGVYATLNAAVSNPEHTYFYLAELASDDRFGGGGENDKNMQVLDHLLYTDLDRFAPFWSVRYKGINRANMAIANLVNMENEELRNQKMGEALFLRALSYFELTQMFGNIPVIEKAPDTVEDAQTPPTQISDKEVYKYIASDLKSAYDMMPEYTWKDVNSGTVTKWAAAGLLARVYLFYTGFFNETSLPTLEGEVTKAEVISALEGCMQKSGHSLVNDYRSLWGYTNSVSKKDYEYAMDASDWVKDGENAEQVFVVKFAYLAAWPSNGVTGYSNQYCLHFGIRNSGANDRYVNLYPFGEGWGAGPVNPGLWNEWKQSEPNDPRAKASILNVEDETKDYQYGADKCMEESGFWQKKYISTRAYTSGVGSDMLYSFTTSDKYYGDNSTQQFQCSHSVDLSVIRYADILLMHSELTETADGINAVRARVGLPAVGYTLENLKKERRHELAFEGTRWGDIRRWGDAETALESQLGQPIYNREIPTVMKDQGAGYAARYKATKGYMPIPSSEIALSNGAIVQNEGWDNSAVYVSWTE